MNKQEAEKVIAEYVKPIFGFALKRCSSQEDAEDLSQEIVLKAFKSLLVKNDILISTDIAFLDMNGTSTHASYP